jgi:pilus assembly protein CpaB
MKPVRIIVLAVAAVCAVGLAVIVRVALSGKPTTTAVARPLPPPRPTARVLVARHDLKLGDRLGDADLDWKTYPRDELDPAWVTESAASAAAAPAAPVDPSKVDPNAQPKPVSTTKQVSADGGPLTAATHAITNLQSGGPKQPFLGAVVREPIAAGEPIITRKIVKAGDSGYLAVVLAPGQRAVSIPVTVDSAAGGFILPGDRVDVILTRKLDASGAAGGGNALYVTQTVLRNMKVLAIDQTTQADKDAAAVIGATVTIEVSADEAETLAVSKMAGSLSLSLRSYADAKAPRGRAGYGAFSKLESGIPSGSAGSHPVRVFRNGEASEAPAS